MVIRSCFFVVKKNLLHFLYRRIKYGIIILKKKQEIGGT
nr:MAG TPA: hypothetical protein [Caudoviricetes sp.]DAO71829.1 MAG TPA: hypothetical protein [Caudoviricetes sp.]